YMSFGLQVILGVIGIVGALGVDSILRLLVVNSAVNIALMLPLVLGLLWKRAGRNAAVWSIVISLVIGGSLMIAGLGAAGDLAALLISAVMMVALSLWWPGRDSSQVAAQGSARHPVAGIALLVAVYTALFLLASAFGGIRLMLPA